MDSFKAYHVEDHQELIDEVMNQIDDAEAKRVFRSNFRSLERELLLSIEYEFNDQVNQNVGHFAQMGTDERRYGYLQAEDSDEIE